MNIIRLYEYTESPPDPDNPFDHGGVDIDLDEKSIQWLLDNGLSSWVDGEYVTHRINWECIKSENMARLNRLASSKASFGFKQYADAHQWDAMRGLAAAEMQAGALTEEDINFIDELLPGGE